MLNGGAEHVHKQYGIGNALRQRAVKPDHGGHKAAADTEHQLAQLIDGRGGIIRSHKDRAQQQAAAQKLVGGIGQVPVGENEHQHAHGADEAHRNDEADHAADEQVNEAQQQRHGANLADAAAPHAEQHLQQRGQLFAVRKGCELRGNIACAVYAAKHLAGEGRCGGNGVQRLGGSKVRHGFGKGYQQHDARRNGGVRKVLADAAEQLLYDNDGHKGTDRAHPQRYGNGQVIGQQQAGDHGAQVPDGEGPLHDLIA